MVVPPPGSNNQSPDAVPITRTAEGLARREIAIAVIADKLGMRPKDVTDDTDLGDRWNNIAMVTSFKTNVVITANEGMKAKDLFDQL